MAKSQRGLLSPSLCLFLVSARALWQFKKGARVKNVIKKPLYSGFPGLPSSLPGLYAAGPPISLTPAPYRLLRLLCRPYLNRSSLVHQQEVRTLPLRHSSSAPQVGPSRCSPVAERIVRVGAPTARVARRPGGGGVETR